LLIAALHDGSSVAEVISAARLLDGVESSLDALTPAVTAGLVHVDTARLSFRHPLARSAVFHASSLSERVAAHNALATVLTDPDARVWHRAAATVGVDEALAEELEGAAMRAQQRGDLRVAIQALDRAVQISEDTTRIARRLLKAAELAFFIGWPETVADLLERAEKLDLSPRDRLKLSCYRVATNGSGSGPHVLVEIADKIRTKEDVNIALDLFTGPGFTWWMLVADAEISRYVISAIESVPGLVSDDDPRFLLLVAVTAPMDRGRFVIERLRNLRQSFSGREDEASLLGGAAIAVGDLETAEHFLSRSAAALRSEGQLLRLTRVLLARAQTAMYFGNIDVAIADAEEGERLAEETRQPPWAAYGQTVTATLAALRGEHELAEAKAAIAAKAIRAPGITASNVAIAQGMNELTARRYENAYAHFQRLFDPTHAAYHQMKGCFYIGDLAEAAVQSGHADEARAILAEMEALSQQTPSPQFHAAMHYARAVLARDTEAERLFETALAADVMRSPFMRARLRLAFGIWLRRAHRPREARSLLQRALEQFDALDAVPWRERTRHELRNAGVVPHRRAPDRRDQLTQRELEIALMAAEGLSNHEIGQKLYLSRRTIGSHLHRLFPKLQITSRRQLREVLGRGHLAT